MSQLKIIRNC